MSDTPDILDHTPPRSLKHVLAAAAGAAAAVLMLGLITRVLADQSEQESTAAAAVPVVKVIHPTPVNANDPMTLPGDIEAYYSAPVYARVTGYLRHWYADIGTHVKKGQILADIDAPDLDQQLQQAKGNLGSAMANEKLAELTAKRYLALKAQNAVAEELVDQQVATWNADKAATASARAIVSQYEAEESFKQLVAPFDGEVTSRSTDVGALITSGTSTSTSTSSSTGTPTGTSISTSMGTSGATANGGNNVPLFTVSDQHRLRIYVRVPQDESTMLRPGTTATFTVPQYPGRQFTAQLVTTADAVDAASGTLNAEFQIDNADGALKPGEYAQMRIAVPAQPHTMVVPASALIFGNSGMEVATVDARNRVALKPVTIGLDLGATVQVPDGLNSRDRVIDNPPDFLRNGDPVRVAAGGPD